MNRPLAAKQKTLVIHVGSSKSKGGPKLRLPKYNNSIHQSRPSKTFDSGVDDARGAPMAYGLAARLIPERREEGRRGSRRKRGLVCPLVWLEP
jgi:hypothetical protein